MVDLGLQWRPPNRWQGFWREARLTVTVAGTEAAPSPPHEATLRGLVDAWADVERAVSAFVASLAADTHVPLEPASRGGFAAGNCGFAGALIFQSIAVGDPDQPGRVELTFYTGYPDGYATYRVVLLDGRPVGVTAFAS